MDAKDVDRLLVPKEAARRLAVGKSMLYKLMADGRLAFVQIGRVRRICPKALAAFVAKSTVPAFLAG